MSSQSWMPLRSFSSEDAVLYRYDDRREGGSYFDDDGDYLGSTGYETTKVVLSVFDIVKKTPKGVWVQIGYPVFGKRWVSNTSTKRYAYPTKEEAWISFIARKQKQYRILGKKLLSIESILKAQAPTEEDFSRHSELSCVVETCYSTLFKVPTPKTKTNDQSNSARFQLKSHTSINLH